MSETYQHAEVPAAPGAPLFFLFHGTDGNETNLLGLGQRLLHDAHLVAPRGDVSEGGALRFTKLLAAGNVVSATVAYARADVERRGVAIFELDRRSLRIVALSFYWAEPV